MPDHQEAATPRPGFIEECVDFWRALPDKTLFFGMLVVWCALFAVLGNVVVGWINTRSMFVWMFDIYDSNPDDSHGKLIPFVVLALFWWKIRELTATPKQPFWPAMALVILGLALHVIGFTVQQTRVSIVGFFTGLYGLTGLVWGKPWLKATFFPMFLFVFCVPFGTLSETITFPLRMAVSRICTALTHNVLGIDVVREGSQIFDPHNPTARFDVAAACSGIRSLESLLAMTTIYGFIVFNSAWRRVLMILIAVPLAVLGNVARISGVIVLAEAFGHQFGAMVEQKLGFITFMVAAACMLLIGRWLRESNSPQTSPVLAETT